MKKTFIFILSIVLIICTIILSKYLSYKDEKAKINEFNLKYEKYLNKEIIGTDIATIINQAVDDNEKIALKKDENGKYIENNENSVNIEIKIKDFAEERTYTMETLYGGGMNEFVKYYGQIHFIGKTIQYHQNGKIKYILFEQIKQ